MSSNSQNTSFAYIVEQPAKCGVRFRYECERRSSVIRGTRQGTFPTVAVAHYHGPIKVIVSCVTKDPPYRAHPHSIDSGGSSNFYLTENSTENSANSNNISGICVAHFPEPIAVFSQLGVLYSKRNAVKEALRQRERLGVDPFGAGFAHRNLFHKLIDFGALRLCFQVFIRPSEDQQGFSSSSWIPLKPIVSEPIYDRKLRSELNIIRLSHDSAPVSGGLTVFLLCERVDKEDIEVRFFQPRFSTEEENENLGEESEVLWERLALFTPNDVHKKVAIAFIVPQYDGQHQQSIEGGDGNKIIPVQVQLRRPSDGCTSESVAFYYYSDHHSVITTSMDTQQFNSYQQSFLLDNFNGAYQDTEQQLATEATFTFPLTADFCSEEIFLSL